jgi:hypothetical protein
MVRRKYITRLFGNNGEENIWAQEVLIGKITKQGTSRDSKTHQVIFIGRIASSGRIR